MKSLTRADLLGLSALSLAVLALFAGVAAVNIATKGDARQREAVRREELRAAKLPPTTDQLLQLQVARNLERVNLRIEQMQAEKSPAVRYVQPRRAAVTRTVATRKTPARRTEAAVRAPAGIWSQQAEESRAGWRAWAADELARLKARNAQ